jgi:hypothetical protein
VSVPRRTIRHPDPNTITITITIYEHYADGRSNGRLFKRMTDGWNPPLPPDVAAALPAVFLAVA